MFEHKYVAKRYVPKASNVRCDQSTPRHANAFKGNNLLDGCLLFFIENSFGLVYNRHPSNKYSIISTNSNWQTKGLAVLRVNMQNSNRVHASVLIDTKQEP